MSQSGRKPNAAFPKADDPQGVSAAGQGPEQEIALSSGQPSGAERLAALAHYRLQPPAQLEEQAFQRLVELAARLCSVPAALISFVNEGGPWVGARCGPSDLTLPPQGPEGAPDLCQEVVRSGEPLVIPDLLLGGHLGSLSASEAGARFYAGAPLRTPEGQTIGALCLLGRVPRAPLTAAELLTLTELASLVMDQLELRVLSVRYEQQVNGTERLARSLRDTLVHSETLQAISELSELGLSLDELLLRGTALCASVCDVDLGSLVAIYNDRAFIFPAWNSPRAETVAALVSRGLRREDCEQIWTTALAGMHLPVFVNAYGTQPGANLAMAQAGVVAQASVLVGQRDDVRFMMVLSRLHQDKPWRPHQQQLVRAVARTMRDLSAQFMQREALAASSAQLALALDSAPLVLFRVDRNGVFQTMRGRGIGQMPWSEYVGRTVEATVSSPQVTEHLRRAMQGEHFDAVVEVGDLTFDIRYTPVRNTQGEPDGALGLGYDVTERVRSERAAVKARREAEALLVLAQTVNGDVLQPEMADLALDALAQVLANGFLVLWRLEQEVYLPVSQRGHVKAQVPDLLIRRLGHGVPLADYEALVGVTDRQVYLNAPALPNPLALAGIRSMAALPLLVRSGRCLVGLAAYSDRPWNPAERDLLETAASIFSAGLDRRERLRDLERDVGTDVLTGIGNRRALDQALVRAVEQARLGRTGLDVVSIDIDGLKVVNDLHGHAQGDALLSSFAGNAQSVLPVGAQLFRLGGDEFVALAPTSGEDELDPAARDWLHRAVVMTRDMGFPQAAASAGYARFPQDATLAAELLALSDARLYAEKERAEQQRSSRQRLDVGRGRPKSRRGS